MKYNNVPTQKKNETTLTDVIQHRKQVIFRRINGQVNNLIRFECVNLLNF